ncbi:MAG: hypothetical protein M3P93_11330 [Actinomycetota bacterium]|nr:hypothetical protein [Actinomycetota bacterium]
MTLASQVPADTSVSAGYVALLLVVLLFIATVLLVRNMSGRLKRLPKEFAPERQDPSVPEQGRPDQGL